jgi:hypothetical protein
MHLPIRGLFTASLCLGLVVACSAHSTAKPPIETGPEKPNPAPGGGTPGGGGGTTTDDGGGTTTTDSGTADATTCTPSTCTGCCQPSDNTCQPGTASSACGALGNPCIDCALGGATCRSGACQ